MAGQTGPNIDPNLSPENALLQPDPDPLPAEDQFEEYRDDQGRLIRRKVGDATKAVSKTGPTTPADPNNLLVPNQQSGAGVEGLAQGIQGALLQPGDPQYESVTGEADQLGPGPGIADPRMGVVPQTDTGATEFEAAQREVQPDELVENRLAGLLSGNSKYIRQARLQGLEHGGGLGGTAGIQAAVGEAIRNGLPIATADAQAFRDAAAQNMDALNKFGLANIQRQTQLQLGNLDAATRVKTTHMNNTTQTAIARLQNATQRDIANLDASTKVKITQMNGDIQGRLAELAFKNDRLLNDQLHGNKLEQISLGGEYDLERQARELQVAQETNYINTMLASYNGALDRLAAYDGIEMDDNARLRAQASVWEGFDGMNKLIQALYPGVEPINFGG
jgi:hypothetical protein